ncbi:MAG: hypothetical protein PHY02_09605 [Phycisphaerae bacterium]|nr:hypothetical protein [Phycisphaerae bacterium]
MCGKPGEYGNPLEFHHIDGRENYATMFLPELSMLLHLHCHKNDPEKAPHKNQPGFEIWLSETYPEKYLLWQSLRYKNVRWFEIDFKQIRINLEARANATAGGHQSTLYRKTA